MLLYLLFVSSLFVSSLFVSLKAVSAECKEIRLSGPRNKPPYSETKGEDLTGLGFSEAQYWFSKIGAKVTIEKTFLDERDALAKLRRGDFDGLVVGYNSGDYEDEFYFSETWHRDSVHIFYLKDRPIEFKGIGSLKNKVGALDYSRDYGSDFERLKTFFLNLNFSGDRLKWISQLESQKIDYFLLPLTEGLVFLKENKLLSKIEISEKALFSSPLHFMIPKKHPCVPALMKLEEDMAKAVSEDRVKNLILNELAPELAPKAPTKPKEEQAKDEKAKDEQGKDEQGKDEHAKNEATKAETSGSSH